MGLWLSMHMSTLLTKSGKARGEFWEQQQDRGLPTVRSLTKLPFTVGSRRFLKWTFSLNKMRAVVRTTTHGRQPTASCCETLLPHTVYLGNHILKVTLISLPRKQIEWIFETTVSFPFQHTVVNHKVFSVTHQFSTMVVTLECPYSPAFSLLPMCARLTVKTGFHWDFSSPSRDMAFTFSCWDHCKT